MSKLSKILVTAGILVGTGLIFKGCTDDIKYETKMINQNRTELFEDKGYFRNRINGYEYLLGLSILAASLYGASKQK